MAHEAKQFSVADWAPLEEAFKRIEVALQSGYLALRDLLDDLRTGRLPSVVRRISRDGAETFGTLEPATWQQMTLRVDYSKRFIVGDPHVDHVTFLSFYFVERRELGKLYPTPGPQRDRDVDAAKETLGPSDRAKAALHYLYPPDGGPPSKLALKAVAKAVAAECERRGWKPPSPDTVARVLGRHRRK